jgi:hypothetical protein
MFRLKDSVRIEFKSKTRVTGSVEFVSDSFVLIPVVTREAECGALLKRYRISKPILNILSVRCASGRVRSDPPFGGSVTRFTRHSIFKGVLLAVLSFVGDVRCVAIKTELLFSRVTKLKVLRHLLGIGFGKSRVGL